MSGKGPDKKVANKLVLLSSTAVFAVYSAGYVRTQKSAEFLAEKAARASAARQQRIAIARVEQTPAAAVSGEPVDQRPSQGAVSQGDDRVSPAAARPTDRDMRQPESIASADPAAKKAADARAAAEAWKLEMEEVEKVERAAAAAAAAAPVSAKAPATPAPSAQASNSKWRDGVYRGWGTSAHGDIEAEVIIEGGVIVLTNISKCETKYPCDYIDHLVPQVVQRQGANVDSVTRCTESVDAFVTAVSSALTQAARKK